MKISLTCINCPMGCLMEAEVSEGQVVSVTGNTCKRGEIYARNEVVHPVRMITSSLPVTGGVLEMVSCKTDQPVDKDKIFEVMECLKDVVIEAPVEIGDILIEHPAGLDANIIATRKVEAR